MSQAVGGPLALPGLGTAAHVHALVLDAASGDVLLEQDADKATPPASTLKLATAAAALTVLGPATRLVTTVVGPAPVEGVVHGDLTLVGAGDPTVTTATTELHNRVSVAAIASTLVAAGVTRVTGSVVGDGLLFTGSPTAAGWHDSYITEGSVAPVTALEVDGGRNAPSPEPAPRVARPALTAAVDLTAALRADHVSIAGEGTVAAAPPAASEVTLAALQGPTVAQLVEQMLTYSDNDLAESLGRLVSLHGGGPADATGAAAAVMAADAAAGLDLAAGGLAPVLEDTSGLSTLDRLAPSSLAAILRAAVGPGHPELRPLALGLPVAARTGTLAQRYKVAPATAGARRVHAKTGALLGVSTEDGYVIDRAGRMLIFAFGSDNTVSRPEAEAALDRAAAALVTLS